MDRPVVVYTNVGVEASLVWFALTLSGYDARLYSDGETGWKISPNSTSSWQM